MLKLKKLCEKIKCGYKQENVENASTVANRSYSVDHNIVKYYKYIN